MCGKRRRLLTRRSGGKGNQQTIVLGKMFPFLRTSSARKQSAGQDEMLEVFQESVTCCVRTVTEVSRDISIKRATK